MQRAAYGLPVLCTANSDFVIATASIRQLTRFTNRMTSIRLQCLAPAPVVRLFIGSR